MKFKITKQKIIAFFGLVAFPVSVLFFVADKYFFVDKPSLEYLMISNEAVLSVTDSLSELRIYYEDQDLIQNQQNLSLITLRIQNTGNTNFRTNDYDENYPIGFSIKNGSLLKIPEVVTASDINYFSGAAGETLVNDSTVNLKPLLLNKSEYYDLKCLVIHSANKTPSIQSFGRVSGMRNIPIVEDATFQSDSNKQKSDGFWKLENLIGLGVIVCLIIYVLSDKLYRKFLVTLSRAFMSNTSEMIQSDVFVMSMMQAVEQTMAEKRKRKEAKSKEKTSSDSEEA